MAFSEKEQELIIWGKNNGKSPEEVKSAVFNLRNNTAPTPSRLGAELPESKAPLSNRIADFVGQGNSTDVFGKIISRSKIGNVLQSDAQKKAAELNARITGQPVQTQQEINRANIEAPTKLQTAGAIASTGSLAVAGGGGILKSMAIGAGGGYLYDVGSDLAEGKTGAEAFAPGVGTLAGAAFPPALGLTVAGAGALKTGASKLLSGVADTASNMSVPNVVGGTADTVQAGFSTLKDRGARLFNRTKEGVADEVAKGERIKNSEPNVVEALRADIDTRIVDLAEEAKVNNPDLHSGMREIVDIASDPANKANPAIVSGRVAGDQYTLVSTARKNVGAEIGRVADELSANGIKVDMAPIQKSLTEIMEYNNITRSLDDSGKEVFNFAGSSVSTKAQRNAFIELYELATELGENATPRQVFNQAQAFSRLSRESRFSGVSDILFEVPNAPSGTKVDAFRAMQNQYRNALDTLTDGTLAPLNQKYAKLSNLQEDLDKTIFKVGKYKTTQGESLDEYAKTGLKRIFGDAMSSEDFTRIYQNLDEASRNINQFDETLTPYAGARADDLQSFAIDMRAYFPDGFQSNKGGFEQSISRSVLSAVGDVFQAGKANKEEQQRALRVLFELDAPSGTKPPVNPASVVDDVTPSSGVADDVAPVSKAVDDVSPVARSVETNVFARPPIAVLRNLATKAQEKGLDFDNLYSQYVKRIETAPADKQFIDDLVTDVATKVPDTTIATAPIKTAERTLEKTIDGGKDTIDDIKDVIRNSLVVGNYSPARVETAKQAIRDSIEVISEKPQKPESFMGYEGNIMVVRTPSNAIAEIQVVSPQMTYGKMEPEFAEKIIGKEMFETIQKETGLEAGYGHKIYEQFRKLSPMEQRSGAGQALIEESEAYYQKLREFTA